MTTREDQINRVVQILSDNYGEYDMDWERYYDLTIFPVENDLNEFETDDVNNLSLKT